MLLLMVAAAALLWSARRANGCSVFPADNIWNAPIDTLPVDANSAAYIDTIGALTGMHADFGSGTGKAARLVFPFVNVPGTQPNVPINFVAYPEKAIGAVPIPPDAPIEWGSDHHDERWDNDDLAELRRIHGSDFRAVDVSSLMLEPDSGQVAANAHLLWTK